MTTAELVESAVLTEASPLMSAGQDGGSKGIWRTRIIQADVQGSSGYYPAEVLMRDGPTAFPAGTHVYLDHPTSDEDEDRPERSVKDLAGYLVDAARFEEGPDGRGLFARIQFIDELKNRIKSLAPVIGLSIRASGEVEPQPGGQRVVRSIAQGLSVDVVTRAGAGGRLVNMTESTAPESPPADQKNAAPESTGTGTINNAIASKVDILSDQVEKLHESLVRIGQALTEQQKITTQLAESNTRINERVVSIDNRQSIADKAIGEATQVGEVAAALAESRLPLASQMRLAANYRPGQDIHKEIQGEREYTKKVVRESARGSEAGQETSGLGMIESTTAVGSVDLSSSASAEDFSEMDAVLSGKLY